MKQFSQQLDESVLITSNSSGNGWREGKLTQFGLDVSNCVILVSSSISCRIEYVGTVLVQ